MKVFKSTIAALLIFQSCVSFKGQLVPTGNKDEAIKNAILDFSRKCKLYKRDSVFSVWAYDTLYRMVEQKIEEGYYKSVRGYSYDGLVAVSIIRHYNKFLVTAYTKIGSKGKLPSRVIEKDGKLFFWWDNNYALTQECFDLLNKYNLLKDDENGTIKYLDITTNDAQKAAHYYFCKNNLIKYKMVITNIAMGYYDAPKLNCNK